MDGAQSSKDEKKLPRHVAIIMDGNGRWAARRGLPRTAGHRQGAETVREVVKTAGELGIEYVTLFSFSSENWSRPESEINELMGLLRRYLRSEIAELHKQNVRLKVIGERGRLEADIRKMIDDAEAMTAENSRMTVVIALSYGARQEILEACRRLAEQIECGELKSQQIEESLFESALQTAGIPDPDLLIRTSGEKRISNFLLWQLAYSELVFVDCHWPEFNSEKFKSAIEEYQTRERRYGAVLSSG